MPPEPFPWDRKDLFRERKHQQHHGHDPVARWRDPPLSSYGGSRTPNDFSPRWGFPSDFRRLTGHGKQGGWYEYPEDFPHGYPTSRYGDRFVDDEGFRPSIPRGDGRYGRAYRENSNTFRQRESRSHSWEANHHQSVSRNASGRPPCMNDHKSLQCANDMKSPHVVSDQMSLHVAKDQKSPHVAKDQKSPHIANDRKSPHIANDQKSPLCVKDQKSVVNSPIRASPPHSDPGDHLRSKEKAVKTSNVSGPGTGQKIDKEDALGVLDWKPVKWSRSGSLTSRCSGFSHSSSAKSIAGESNDVKSFLPGKKLTPVQSPSGDADTCPLSISPSDDTISRKKPRLGWGMGLAKFERHKGDGPEENNSKAGNVSPSNVEHTHLFNSNLVEKSPRIAVFSDCSSPATPSSVACSSSQGLEDKAYGRTLGADVDPNNFCMTSMVPVPENRHEGLHFILEKLVLNSITDLSSLISELLQADEQCSLDSCFKRSSILNKLLLWKDGISKSLEITETEIDSLENELKSLSSDCGSNSPCLVSLSSLSADCEDEPHEDLNVIQRPPALEVVSSKDMEGRETLPCDDARGSHTENKDEVIDSSGTATSKFLEPLGVQKRLVGTLKQGSEEMGLVESTKSGMQSFVRLIDTENTLETSCQGGERKMVHDDCVPSSCENLSLRDQKVNSICDSIFAYNKDSSARASEVLDKLLPDGNYCFGTMEANRGSILPAELTIADKFLRKKRFVRFKESVLSLKYRAFHHLWKEDLRLLSLKNNRTKSQTKIDPSTRATLYGSQKHRSSIRSRFTSPAGSLSLVPTTEMVKFTSKVLSDSQLKTYRDSLKMPAMFLDEKERSASRFLSNNRLVEDPCALEKERALINPWTNEEKEIFIDKLATLGKDFGKIAYFLDHKTTADCVEFYYKNHKSECFEKTKKKQGKPLSTTTYLVTSEKKWSREREMNVASLDILGAASVIAAQAEEAIEPSKASSGKSRNRKPSEDERETAAADVLAGICGSLSSEAMSSCITSSVDPAERNQDLKDGKVTQKVDNDDDSYSDESCGEMDPVYWTDDDKSLFVEAFLSYGNDFTMISRVVRTKSRDQCRVFFSKARKCLGLDSLPHDSGIHGTSEETGSVVCSDKSGSRIDEELPYVNQDVSKPEAMVTDMNTLDDNCSAEKAECRDDISRSELRRIIQDDSSKADASIGMIDIERGKLENDLVNVTSSLIVLVGPREGGYRQSRATGDESKLDLSLKADANRIIPHKMGSEAKAQSFADTFLRKCRQKQPLQDAETASLPVLVKNEELETEKPCRNGKVKLFGKILSTPEIPTCSAQINDMSMHEHNNLMGLENVPIRSYGFWDGTEIQTGFSSMQNSALLLAKYPAAYGNSLFPEAEQIESILKQKQDTFPEAKSDNFEGIPRLQDGGEVVVGNTVAALKMQYMLEPLNINSM